MTGFTATFNQIMSVLVFGGLASCAVLLYTLVLPKATEVNWVRSFVGKYILSIGFLMSLSAIVSSLIYSEVIGYAPCMLCWLARVAFYPQAILYAMATFKQDKKILDYSLALSIFGLFVVLYNYYLEFGGNAIIPCSATGPSCEARYVFEYGFITIPFMGIVGFTSLIFAILVAKKANKTSI